MEDKRQNSQRLREEFTAGRESSSEDLAVEVGSEATQREEQEQGYRS